MKKTLILDDDVAAMLEMLRRRRNTSLRKVVNEALRQGLRYMATPPKKRKRFETRSVSLGRCLIGSIDDVGDLLAVAEHEAFK